MAEYDLGTAKGKIEIDASGAKRGIDETNQSINQLGDSAEKRSGALRSMSTAMIGLGAGIVGGFAIAVNASAEFEKELSAFKAVTSATGEEIDSIREKALQLGRDTAYGAGQSLAAMTELGKAGLSTADILDGAADATVSLAAAGEIDLSEAAKIAAAALNQFKLEAADLPGVADTLAGAANASATGVSEIGMAFEYVGPVAAAAGMSLEDTAATIALLSNNGIDGAKAGTALRSILSQLQPTTDKAKNAMEDLGLYTEEAGSAFFDATGEILPMNEIVGMLNTSMKDLTSEQKLAYAEAMFGREALSAVAAMAGTTVEEFLELQGSIEGISASDVAAERLDNLAGSLTILKGTVETFLISAGSPFQEVLKGIVDKITEVINWLAQLDPAIQRIIAIAIASFGAFALVAGIMVKVVMGFQTFWNVLKAMQLGALLANPIGLIILALLALAAAFVMLWKKSEDFRDIVRGAFAAVQPVIDTLVGWFQSAVDWFQRNWPKIQAVIERVWDAVKKAFWAVVDAVVPWVKEKFQTVVDWFETNWPKIAATIDRVWETVKKIFWAVVNAVVPWVQERFWEVVNWFERNWPKIAATIDAVWEEVKRIFWAVVDAVVPWVTERFQEVVAWFEENWPKIAAKVDEVWEAVKATFFAIADEIVPWVTARYQEVVDWFETNWPLIKDTVGTTWDTVWTKTQEVANLLVPWVQEQFGNVVTWFQTNWPAIREANSMVWDAVWGTTSTIVSEVVGFSLLKFGEMITWFQEIFPELVQAVGVVWDRVKIIFTVILGILLLAVQVFLDGIILLWEAWGDDLAGIVDTIWTGIKSILDGYLQMIQGAVEAWIGVMNGDWDRFWGGIKKITSGAGQIIVATIQIMLGVIRGILAGFISTAQGLWNTGWETMKRILTTAWEGIKTATSTAIANLVNFFVGLPGKIIAAIGNLGGQLMFFFAGAFGSLRGSVSGQIGTLLGLIGTIPGRILGALGGLGGLLIGAGVSLIGGLIRGVTSMIGSLASTLGGITNMIPSWKGPPETDKKLLVDNGKLIMGSLVTGFEKGYGEVEDYLGSITSSIPIDMNLSNSGIGGSSLGTTSAASAGTTISIGQVVIPAKDLEEMRTVQDFFDRIQQVSRQGV